MNGAAITVYDAPLAAAMGHVADLQASLAPGADNAPLVKKHMVRRVIAKMNKIHEQVQHLLVGLNDDEIFAAMSHDEATRTADQIDNLMEKSTRLMAFNIYNDNQHSAQMEFDLLP
jgi:microcompartment protein CcmL/EutN